MKTLLLALALALPAVAAHADLVVADSRFGPGTLTLDSDQGLAFLDVPLSADMTVLAVEAELQPDGIFNGFRYATRGEVAALLVNAGFPDVWVRGDPGPVDASPANLPFVGPFTQLVGATNNFGGMPNVHGITGSRAGGGREGGDVRFRAAAGSPGYEVTAGYWIYSTVTATPYQGHWLVAVPEPAAATFAAAAGLLLARRRRPAA